MINHKETECLLLQFGLPFSPIIDLFHLSSQSPDELIEMAHKYYADTALPKLVCPSSILVFLTLSWIF